jgi:hypothetical protein
MGSPDGRSEEQLPVPLVQSATSPFNSVASINQADGFIALPNFFNIPKNNLHYEKFWKTTNQVSEDDGRILY